MFVYLFYYNNSYRLGWNQSLTAESVVINIAAIIYLVFSLLAVTLSAKTALIPSSSKMKMTITK